MNKTAIPRWGHGLHDAPLSGHLPTPILAQTRLLSKKHQNAASAKKKHANINIHQYSTFVNDLGHVPQPVLQNTFSA